MSKSEDRSLSDRTVRRPRYQHEVQPETIESSRKRNENWTKKNVRIAKHSNFLHSPKQKSAKNSINSIKTLEDAEKLSRQTSQQVIKSIYQLISYKFPCTTKGGEIPEKDQEEIQGFFTKKKAEFGKLLQEISKTSKKNSKKVKKNAKKHEDLSAQRFQSEIDLIQKRQKVLKKDLIRKASEKILKQKSCMEKQKKIEKNFKKREEQQLKDYEKEIIIKNIENFYKDRALIIKDSMQKDLEARKIIEYDEKNYISSLLKQQKDQRKQDFSSLKYKYEQEIEYLKDQFNSI